MFKIFSLLVVMLAVQIRCQGFKLFNTCTLLNASAYLDSIFGVGYVHEWTLKPGSCAEYEFKHLVNLFNITTATSTLTTYPIKDPSTKNSKVEGSFVTQSPFHKGENLRFSVWPDITRNPAEVSVISAYIVNVGYGLASCQFWYGYIIPTLYIVLFDQTRNDNAIANLKNQLSAQGLDVTALKPVLQDICNSVNV